MSGSLSLSFLRSRWAAVGAAVAVTLGAGGIAVSGAATSTPSSITTITPCRIMDTRAATSIGGRSTPLGAGATHTINVWGNQGNCTIPNGATGVVMNVTFTNPTEGSFLTVWPSDVTRPLASTANWGAGRSATSNQVTTALSSDGRLSFYNDSGTVDLVVDIVGYLTPAGLGAPPTQQFFRVSNGSAITINAEAVSVDAGCGGQSPATAQFKNRTVAPINLVGTYDNNPVVYASIAPNDTQLAEFPVGDHHFQARLWNAPYTIEFEFFMHITPSACEISIEMTGK